MSFTEFESFDPLVHHPDGWAEWEKGKHSYREVTHDRSVRVIDYILTLGKRVLGHSIKCIPDDQGVSGIIFRCPTYLKTTVAFESTPDREELTTTYFVPFYEVELLVPHERHIVKCEHSLLGVFNYL